MCTRLLRSSVRLGDVPWEFGGLELGPAPGTVGPLLQGGRCGTRAVLPAEYADGERPLGTGPEVENPPATLVRAPFTEPGLVLDLERRVDGGVGKAWATLCQTVDSRGS
jgi:hypothetical protein